MGRHHVREHHWINGLLNTIDHFFESLEEAVSHANKCGAHTTKVYNFEGELVHIATPVPTETYA